MTFEENFSYPRPVRKARTVRKTYVDDIYFDEDIPTDEEDYGTEVNTPKTTRKRNTPTRTKSLQPDRPKRKQVKNACINCQKACKKCDQGRPCQRCIKYGLTETCKDSLRKNRRTGAKRGPYRVQKNENTPEIDKAASKKLETLSQLCTEVLDFMGVDCEIERSKSPHLDELKVELRNAEIPTPPMTPFEK